MTPRSDRRQAIPSMDLPKALNPGRQWHIAERFPAQYSLYENCTTPEGYHTVRPMFRLFYVEPRSVWCLWDGRLGMDFPDSYDPPFGIAEALYDAAK
jgi:hypothetical protein